VKTGANDLTEWTELVLLAKNRNAYRMSFIKFTCSSHEYCILSAYPYFMHSLAMCLRKFCVWRDGIYCG